MMALGNALFSIKIEDPKFWRAVGEALALSEILADDLEFNPMAAELHEKMQDIARMTHLRFGDHKERDGSGI